MSGGSMDYLYEKIEEFADCFEDPELVALAHDFAQLAHDCEWYHSSDTGIGEYRQAVEEFKRKWFCPVHDRDVRLKKYFMDYIDKILGTYNRCGLCKHYRKSENETYGSCDLNPRYLSHPYDDCLKFEPKE